MKQPNPWKSYQQIAAKTASPGQLILMLYDGAIKFLNRALSGFDEEDPATRNQTINNNVLRAQDIINELNGCLNLEAGGELAMHMGRVYSYLDWRLSESNLKKEAEGIEEAVQRLSELRNVWAEMLASQCHPEYSASAGPVSAAAFATA